MKCLRLLYSYQRLLFTLLQNVSDMKVGVRRYFLTASFICWSSHNILLTLYSLISETRRILNEEIELRAFALDKGIFWISFLEYACVYHGHCLGVKDLSQLVAIPPNDFSTIDEKVITFNLYYRFYVDIYLVFIAILTSLRQLNMMTCVPVAYVIKSVSYPPSGVSAIWNAWLVCVISCQYASVRMKRNFSLVSAVFKLLLAWYSNLTVFHSLTFV